MSRKLVIDDGRSQRELLVVGTMVVGRDQECEISSSDPRLSRKHAEFRATSSSVMVRDLGSRNGVRVNGKPVTEATLAPGDVVSIAHLSMQFLDEADGPAAPRPVGAPVTIAAPIEDDRTRAVSKSAIGAVASVTAAEVRPEVVDDRTRVLPAGARGRVAMPATATMSAMPADVGEIVIRDARSSAPPAAVPAQPTATAELGVQALAGTGWGRRVLMQGLLLVLVVYLITVIPLLAWQSRVFGASALQAWSVLLPTLGASVFAGIMVAGLIARTTARGAQDESRG